MLGDNIKRERMRKNLGLNQLANLVGMSPGYLSNIENNKVSNPTMDKLKQIADALNVSLDRLTGEAASCLIDDRLEELGMSLEELASKAGVPLSWLQNLDNFVPGQPGDFIGEGRPLDWNDVIGDFAGYKSYRWITKVAEVLGLPGSILRAALARQEVPIYDGPMSTPEEDFSEPMEVNVTASPTIPEWAKRISPEWQRMLAEEPELANIMLRMMNKAKKEQLSPEVLETLLEAQLEAQKILKGKGLLGTDKLKEE